MKHTRYIFLLGLTTLLLLATACAGSQTTEAHAESNSESADDEHMDDDSHQAEDEHDDDEHGMDHLHVEAPEEFASLENPFINDHEATEAGEETFNTLCATCHGEKGKGDGPGSVELDPKPADLSDGMMMSDLSDGYLFWRVSKGGAIEPFNSAMPAWESGLTEDQRWQVIGYIRTLSEEHNAMEESHETDGHMDDDHADDEHMDDGHVDDGHVDDEHGSDEHDE